MRPKIIILCAAVAITAAILLFTLPIDETQELRLEPRRAEDDTLRTTTYSTTEVGTGWSTNEDPTEAVREAVGMALRGKTRANPDFAVIYASSGSNMELILSAAKKVLGPNIKIFGGTSDSRAVMTNKGYVKVSERGYELAKMQGRRGLAIMTISSCDLVVGVGSGDASAFASPQEMAKAAILSAFDNAGKSSDDLPAILLLSVTIGIEEEALEGAAQVIGNNVPILGGTVGGPTPGVFGQDKAYSSGVSLAVMYTDLPIGWTFEGGFDVTADAAGIVTEVDDQDIVEIDGRPALDVYNEWLDGEIERLHEEVGKPDVIRDLLTLHPLYRKYTSPGGQHYFLFSHPWPKDDQMNDRSISTSTKISPGERIYLSHGTWETLINRVGNMPKNAKLHGGIRVDAEPILSIGFVCGGVMGVIPVEEREKIPLLINYANNNGPFIANFTWGEQGHFPGIGNRHGNLLTSFMVVGPKETQR